MLLSKLFSRIKTKNTFADKEFASLTADSRKVQAGDVFVCINGKNFDAHDFAPQALEKGAAAVVVERDLGLEGQIIVDNTREAYALMAAAYFDYPADKLKLIGITGTNGKTTTSFLIKGMLDYFGKKTGLIGTIKYMIGQKEIEADFTTPEYFELNQLFAKMLEEGCEYCVMEVSSQALAQFRVAGLHFKAAIFTNLTQDHLDYHGSFENYLKAKAMLFEISDLAIMNMDDPSWQALLENSKSKLVTYSVKDDESTYMAKNIRLTASFTEFEFLGDGIIGRVHLGIPGEFSVYNALAALIALMELGFDFHECREAMSTLEGVKGRIEVLETERDFTVIIDYAHTPDALENIIKALKSVAKGRIISLFGCGGDRDKTKRPIMGEIATRLSDYVVITSDNPRQEEPMSIIKDIEKGIDKSNKTPTFTEVDRTKAIDHALKIAGADDIILLLGKGHETYQIIGKEKIHYDEREVVKKLLTE